MTMQADEITSRLRALAATGDDWFSVWESEEGRFQISDLAGAAAVIIVEEHWVEVRAGRPMTARCRTLTLPPAGGASLLRIMVSDGTPPTVTICGRVYLDGFSLHALVTTARDVLTLAGPLPLPSEPEHAAGEPAPVDGATTVVAGELERSPAELGEHDAVAADTTMVSAPDERSSWTADVTRPGSEAETELGAESPAAITDAASLTEEEPRRREEDLPEPVPIPTEVRAPIAIAGTPLAPTTPSSVGATIQISRQHLGEIESQTEQTPQTPSPPGIQQQERLICRRCGSEVESGERFCINCGAPQPAAGPATEDQPQPPSSSAAATIVWRRPQANLVACPRCGESNPGENRFCQSCGATLRDA